MAMTDALRAAGRRLYPSAELVLATGTRLALGADDIVSLSVQEGADSALTPGCVISASCALTLDNSAGRWEGAGADPLWHGFEGATALLYLNALDGETWRQSPLGVFIVRDISVQEQRPVIRLSGCDSIGSELSGAFADALEYPSTLEALWLHAVGQSRYEWSGEVPNGDAVIDAQPAWGEASLRQVMGWIAAAAGCFVRVDRAGALRLEPCRRQVPEASLDADAYMTLTQGFQDFGPVDGLQITPAKNDAGESEVLTVYATSEPTGETLAVKNNPLFVHGADHLRPLAEGMLSQLAGLRLSKVEFRWRGDPAVGVGTRIGLTDTRGAIHEATVTRQTLQFDGGFSATCACETPDADRSGVPRAITPEGGVNGEALVGTVDGGLLKAGSVVTQHLAAGSITTQKLAAGSVVAEKIQSHTITAEQIRAGVIEAASLEALRAHIGALTAQTISTDALAAQLARITRAEIGSADIDWADIENLNAAVADILQARIADLWADVADILRADIDWANVQSLSAAVAEIVSLQASGIRVTTAQIEDLRAQIAGVIALAAQDGRFGFAGVQQLVADAMLLEEGVAGTVTIRNLAATQASFVGATLGGLVLRGEDSLYYDVAVQADGTIHTREVSVTEGERLAGETADGRPIVATEANIVALNADTLRVQSATVGGILAGALSAGKISASEAFLASASVPELYATAIRAIGDTLTLSAAESIRLAVGEAVRDTVSGARNYLPDSAGLSAARLTARRSEALELAAHSATGRWHWRLCGAFDCGGYAVHARLCGTFACGEGAA